MNKFRVFGGYPTLIMAFLVMMLTGCASDSSLKEENEKLRQERDELSSNLRKDSLYIVSMSSEMDELYANLDSMRAREERIRQTSERMRAKQVGGREGGLTIDESIADLEKLLAENQRKIANLQNKLSKEGKQNAFLQKQLNELNKVIQDRDQYIGELKVQVTDLQNEVAGWKSKYALTTAERDSVQTVLTAKEGELNTAFYVIGTKKDLEKRGLIDTKGLFSKVDGLSTRANDESFTKVDIRYTNEINIGNHKIKNIDVLPKRAENTYTLEQRGGEVVLKINDSRGFWKNKYLAVVTK